MRFHYFWDLQEGMIEVIVTVTMNPAIDKTVEVEKLVCKGLNRIRNVVYDAGGKGVNVSKTICELGGQSIATGFLGGNSGQIIDNVLKDYGITSDFVWVTGETRTNTKVVEEDGSLTELNEPGTIVCDEDVQNLKAKLLEYANEKTMFVFSGSIPSGVSKDIYREFICLVKEKGACAILDADGEVFRNSLGANPSVIKPNQVELEGYLGLKEQSDINELVVAAKGIQKQGVENIMVSMGAEGALFLMGDYEVLCEGLSVNVSSTVGAGDAMVAAYAYAWDTKLSKEETVKLCMATSAGAVTTTGTKPPSKELVEQLMTQVKIKGMGA